MDPDPAIFFSNFLEGNKKYFFCLLLLEGTGTFLKDKKVIKKLQNTGNQGVQAAVAAGQPAVGRGSLPSLPARHISLTWEGAGLEGRLL